MFLKKFSKILVVTYEYRNSPCATYRWVNTVVKLWKKTRAAYSEKRDDAMNRERSRGKVTTKMIARYLADPRG